MRISDWSSDVCSSDLRHADEVAAHGVEPRRLGVDRDHARLGRPVDPAPQRVLVLDQPVDDQIGRASCRERVCQYVQISGGAGSFKKKKPEIVTVLSYLFYFIDLTT